MSGNSLFEKISCSFQLGALIPFNELVEIINKEHIARIVIEDAYSLLKDFVGLLKIMMIFKKINIVYNHQRSNDFEINHFLISSTNGFNCS